MSRSRFFSLATLAAGCLVVLAAAAAAQDADLPKTPPNILSLKDSPVDKKAKEAFSTVAKYYADYISNPKVYANAQEVVPNPRIRNVDQLIRDLNYVVLAPLPDGRVGIDQADYLREVGVALDKELKGVIDSNPTPIVRINAMRLLAAACRSGAFAHYPTITNYIASKETPPEVKYYAFEAAANLLSAYDINNASQRLHSNNAKEVTALVAALQDAILKPDGILPLAKDAKRSPGEIPVIQFIRRQAIKALGRCRFSDKVTPVAVPAYPAFTLAQVAVQDPAIQPPPSKTEVAEAVIGICNMSPPRRLADRMPYAQAMADAVASGIVTFSADREAGSAEKSLPWKSYAMRFDESLSNWRTVFNPLYDPRKPTVNASDVPEPVEKLNNEAKRLVIAPMMSGIGAVSVNKLREFRDTTLRADKRWTLAPFAAEPSKVLPKAD